MVNFVKNLLLKRAERRELITLGALAKAEQASGGAKSFFPDRGDVRWYGGYPFYFDSKSATLDNNSVIEACIGWIARNFPEPPVMVATLNEKGETDKDYGHKLAELLRRPDLSKMTGRRLMKKVIAAWHLMGDVYLDIVLNGRGVPVELSWIPPHACEPVCAKDTKGTDQKTVLSHYMVTLANGKKERREKEEILHFANGIDSGNPLKGCSPLKSALRLVMTDESAAAYSDRVLRNLDGIGLMIAPASPDVTIEEHDRKLLQAQARQQFGGEGQGGTYVAGRQVKIEYVGIDPSKIDITALHRIPEERISAIFGVAAIVVGLGAGLARSTFANFAEAREAATEQLLIPLWAEFADFITYQLGPLFKLAPNQFFGYDISKVKILQEDENAKWERNIRGWESGMIKRSEAKQAVGLEVDESVDNIYLTDIQPGGADQAAKIADTSKARAAQARKMKQGRRHFEELQAELNG